MPARSTSSTHDRTTGDGITTSVVITCWLKRSEQAVDETARCDSRGKHATVDANNDGVKTTGKLNMHGSESAARCTRSSRQRHTVVEDAAAEASNGTAALQHGCHASGKRMYVAKRVFWCAVRTVMEVEMVIGCSVVVS
jgi:hypothetical protein